MFYNCNDDLYKERPECKANTLNISENSEKEITLNSNDNYDMYSTEFFIESTESELNKHIDSNLYHTFEFQTEILTFYPQSTSKNTDNIPFFELYVVQVRIIDNKLKIYAFLLIKIENLVRITITIDLYTNSSIRSLQETSNEKLEIDLYINNNSDIQPGKIFELTSKEQFSESDRIVINKQKYSDYEMKVLDNDIKILDTQENEKMIKNGKVADFSKLSDNDDDLLHLYIIESSSSGCNFDLISNNPIEEKNQDITLNFTEIGNNNIIGVKCSLSNENGNKIPCSLDQEISKTFTLDPVYTSIDNDILVINSTKTFQLNCQNEESKKESNSEIIILVIGVLFLVIVIILIITIICCKIKKVNRVFINEGELPKYIQNNEDSISEKDIDSYYKRRFRKNRKY